MILDLINNIKFDEINISESLLQKHVVKNFEILFPDYRIIESEYRLVGDVRKFGLSGRIDIFALNLKENRLVVFELKKDNNKNILFQAIDYSDFISENYNLIILSTNNLSLSEKDILLKNKQKPEIILIAKNFNHPTIRRIQNIENIISLYEYKAFQNNFIQFELLFNKGNNKIVFSNKEKKAIEKIDSTNVNLLIKEAIRNLDESYYLIESNVLAINPTILYNSFKTISNDFNITHLTKGKFLKLIRESDFYIEDRKTMRFKDYNTSVILIKIQ